MSTNTITDSIFEALAGAIREAYSRSDSLFDCREQRIIIPSRINRTFIDLALARRGLALTGVGYDTLDWSVLRLAKALEAENIEDNLTRRDVFAHLLMLLRPDLIGGLFDGVPGGVPGAAEAKKTLTDYMAGDGLGSVRYSLAHVLSGLFVRYAEEDPDLLSTWEDKKYRDPANPIEVTEACLYNKLLEKGSLPGAFHFGQEGGTAAPAAVPEMHILGYGYISATVLEQLNELGKRTGITLYHEDLPQLEGSSALIQGWNRVTDRQNENIKGISEYKEGDSGQKGLRVRKFSDDRFAGEKDPKTVIRKSFGAADGNIEDKIRIIPCPGPEREAEAVWSCVCHDLSRKDGEGHHLYSPEDILVLVCDPAKYYPHMERVFGRRETNGGKTVSVPFNLTCVRPGPVSSYLDGVAALFDLMGSRMERFRMEKLFTNPCFLSRRGLEYGEVEDWLKRIEDCGVWEGFEAEPGADPLHTWKHAGRRFRLAEASGESWGGMTPPDGRPGKKDDALLALAELLREELCRLAALDAKDRKDMDANDAKETADRVFDGVLTLLEGWLTPDKKEAGMAGYVADRLNKFRKQCETRNYVPYIRDLRYFLEITAEPMQFEHGQPFTGGVMTGHIKNITFPACKALYLLGFNEDNFPGRDDASSLDLTGEGRVTQTDLNRFAFLRAVLWATDKVYITYDCKDRVKNTERFPSSCVRDLEELLDIKEEETLSLFARTDVNKGKEWTAPCHGEDLEEARALNVKKTQNTENNDEDSQQGSGGQTGNNVSGEEGPQGAAELTINRIRDFLLDPGDYYLSYVLGIADFDRDRRSRDFIPPATDAKDKWRYERPAYLACAKDKQAAAGDSYDSEYRQQGRAPEGPLADIERTLLEQDKAFDRIRNYEGSAEKVPLRLTTEQSGMEVTVTGEAHIFESEEEVRVFVPKKIGELRHRIEAWVTGAVYLLSRDPGKPVRICGTDKEYLLVCGAEDQKVDIKSRLAGVCGALTGLTSFYSAPAELVSDLAKDIAEANAPAPEENDAKTGDGSANDTEKTADKKQIVSERLRELIAADMAKIKKGYQPTHYWHTLLKEHPDRLVLPGWEELSAAAERLRPILELKEQKNK